jgi:hypothetical protein
MFACNKSCSSRNHSTARSTIISEFLNCVLHGCSFQNRSFLIVYFLESGNHEIQTEPNPLHEIIQAEHGHIHFFHLICLIIGMSVHGIEKENIRSIAVPQVIPCHQ